MLLRNSVGPCRAQRHHRQPGLHKLARRAPGSSAGGTIYNRSPWIPPSDRLAGIVFGRFQVLPDRLEVLADGNSEARWAQTPNRSTQTAGADRGRLPIGRIRGWDRGDTKRPPLCF
jgi:hypothetical protein